MTETRGEVALSIRPLEAGDLEAVIRIDAAHTGEEKRPYWDDVFERFIAADQGHRIGLAAVGSHQVEGYLLGEIRALEFGSERCGWIFAVAVDPIHLRGAVATQLLDRACQRFREHGVTKVRTMVQRNNVPVMSFFRSRGFFGGPFVQLERDLSETPREEQP